MTKVHTPERVVPTLDGWLTSSQIADRLDISRQSVARMMSEGVFRTQHQVGSIFIARGVETEQYLKLFKELHSWPEAAAALKKLPKSKVW